jgi:antitoxin component YwqK of YwqJK toxin-antitoxin module
MIVKTARISLRIAFFLIVSCQITKAQSGGSMQKVDDVSKPKLDWTYQYQFTNADSTEGIEKAFNREGKIVAETYFKDKGEFQFVKRYSTKTGNLIKSDTIVNFKKIVGSSMSYFASGKIKEIEHRDTSGAIDQYRGYFESGQKKVIIHYKNGKRNGLMTEYNPNGTVKETGNYLNDKREGQFKFYDVRGNLLASKKFKQDKIVK